MLFTWYRVTLIQKLVPITGTPAQLYVSLKLETNGSKVLYLSAMQGNFEVVLKIWECVWSLRQLLREFATEPPTQVTVKCFHDQFEAEGFVHALHKQQSRRPDTSVSPAFSAMVLQQFSWSSKNPKTLLIRQISMASVHLTLKKAK